MLLRLLNGYAQAPFPLRSNAGERTAPLNPGLAHTLSMHERHVAGLGLLQKEVTMASATAHPNHQLISSEDVEGTDVYDPKSTKIGPSIT